MCMSTCTIVLIMQDHTFEYGNAKDHKYVCAHIDSLTSLISSWGKRQDTKAFCIVASLCYGIRQETVQRRLVVLNRHPVRPSGLDQEIRSLLTFTRFISKHPTLQNMCIYTCFRYIKHVLEKLSWIMRWIILTELADRVAVQFGIGNQN